ncbi:MAG TPA: BamA/TamA family outer membrane protein [Tepidisphaeraceae bacterium]|jgi:hypothetical protein
MRSVFQRVCAAGSAAIGVFAGVILIQPSGARGGCAAAGVHPACRRYRTCGVGPESPLAGVGAAVGNYADRAAPILPAGNEETSIDNAAAAYEIPATPAPPGRAGSAATLPATTPSQPAATPAKGEFLIAPLPHYSPTFGWGVIGRLGYIFPLNPEDKVSPPSIVGAFGYYSQNQSWAAGLASKLYLDEDRYRVTAALMHAELNYDFSGIGTAAGTSGQSVPLDQEMTGGIFEALFKVAPNFYVGPKYIGSKMHINVTSGEATSSISVPVSEANSIFSGLGLHAQWDTRDSQFYPRKGYLADIDISFHDPAVGDDFAYQVLTLSYNHYFSLASNQVLAVRALGEFENGDVPFYALCKFGRGSDLRGYRVGQFQDTQMFAPPRPSTGWRSPSALVPLPSPASEK